MEETIEFYKNELALYKEQMAQERIFLLGKKKEAIKQAIKKSLFDQYKKSHEIANRRIDNIRIRHSTLISGVFVYECMQLYETQKGVQAQEMAYLILMSITGLIRESDLYRYGVTHTEYVIIRMKNLRKKGLVEIFMEHSFNQYMISIKGLKLVRDFQAYYNNHIIELIKSDDYKKFTYNWETGAKPIGRKSARTAT